MYINKKVGVQVCRRRGGASRAEQRWSLGKEEMKEEEMVAVPAWLRGLLGESFFSTCYEHQGLKKNEKNIFCLSCCSPLCPKCLPSHSSHPLLQIRRYVYHDVARLEDIDKLVDCSYVQPYTINSAKVVFLKPRQQSRACKGSGRNCLTCDRVLQDPFHFCSLSCKVEHVVLQERDLSGIVHSMDPSDHLAISQFEGLRVDAGEEDAITPSSILEAPMHFRGSSCSTNSSTMKDSEAVVKKEKKGSSGIVPNLMLSLSRRKGAPQRAPFS